MFISDSLLILVRFCCIYAFCNHQHRKMCRLHYCWGHQNPSTALFLGTSKFVDHVIFVPQKIFGLPIFSSWLKPWATGRVVSEPYGCQVVNYTNSHESVFLRLSSTHGNTVAGCWNFDSDHDIIAYTTSSSFVM